MRPGLPGVLELAVCKASGLLHGDDDEDDEEDQGMFAPPEQAVSKAAEYRECDLIHTLHQHGYTYDTIYPLLIPEIDELMDGAERAEQRDGGGGKGSGDAPAQGNRGGSHANDLWG